MGERNSFIHFKSGEMSNTIKNHEPENQITSDLDRAKLLWCQLDEQKFVLKLNYSIPLFIWVSVTINDSPSITNWQLCISWRTTSTTPLQTCVYKKRSRKTGDSSAKAMLPVVFIWIICESISVSGDIWVFGCFDWHKSMRWLIQFTRKSHAYEHHIYHNLERFDLWNVGICLRLICIHVLLF